MPYSPVLSLMVNPDVCVYEVDMTEPQHLIFQLVYTHVKLPVPHPFLWHACSTLPKPLLCVSLLNSIITRLVPQLQT